MTTPRVNIAYVAPPIPWREYDWEATDGVIVGQGPTQDDAITDYLHNWNEAQDATHPAN
jgi:hypothetical protein